ncbi:MAG: putative 4-mercaptohistidine N1-methyltransferase [Chthoniobacterales bacterium]
MNLYETDQLLSEYLLFHYGKDEEVLPHEFGPKSALNFPMRCVSELLPLSKRDKFKSAVDIGCAVGRSSFELARYCDKVVGIDYSAKFIEAAKKIQQHGRLPFSYIEEGKRMHHSNAVAPEDIDRSRVSFEVGDALCIPEELNGADLVLAGNLICRLPAPAQFLLRLSTLLQSGGIFILASPYTWLEAFTPLKNWLGSKDAHDISAFQAIQQILAPHFELLGMRELPFLIREHSRKYQWSISHGSVWRRK